MFACLLPKKTACDTSSRYPTALAGKVSQLAVSVCPSVCYHSIFWINNPWLCFFARSWVTTIAGRGLKVKVQWRRQRSKGARSFRSQKILKPGQVTQSPGRCEGLAWPSGVANWGRRRGLPPFPSLPLFVPLPFPFSPLPLPSLPLEVGPLKSR